jgi:DNA modification methylase
MLEILTGNCLDILPTLPPASVQCCVTSPPYWGLRDYGVNGQAGLEETPEAYVANMVAVFREVKRVLRDDGTLWLNLGDTYATNGYTAHPKNENAVNGGLGSWNSLTRSQSAMRTIGGVLKSKDLCGTPWRVAFALQADGWYLRSDIIWHKPNPMPESVTDRPTKAHEYIFLLSKSERYFYDAEAVREASVDTSNSARSTLAANGSKNVFLNKTGQRRTAGADTFHRDEERTGRNRRTVWTITTQPYSDAHFATFPEELPKLCILAGSKPGDMIMDPFAGSGTTGKVALELGRKAVLIELNPAYATLTKERTNTTIGFF